MPRRPGRSRVRRRPDGGASLVELLVAIGLASLVGLGAWRALAELRDERAAREAARGVVADLRRLAIDARRLAQARGVEIDPTPPARWRVLADGNGNGITTADIASGVDAPTTTWTWLFREGVARLAVERDLPDADGDGVIAAGSTPVRLGVVPRIVFTARGTSSAGSLYVAGPGGRAYAIRLLGTTQRVRLLCLGASGAWEIC
jgi:type II secretory pathway pseudopilin PulG